MIRRKNVGFLSRIIIACLLVLSGSACTARENEQAYEQHGNTVVLLYHTFLEESEITNENADVATSPEKFESDILTLLSCGYKPISLYDLFENKNDANNKYFAITMDDGYLSNYEIAYPILKKHNCYADIFINTDNEYMEHHFSFSQAAEMEKSGLIAIHSHFPLHEDVSKLSNKAFQQELTRSFDTLTEKLGERKYSFFAYPYGSYNEEKYSIAVDCGVKLQFIQRRASEAGQFIIRVTVTYNTDIDELLETAYLN